VGGENLATGKEYQQPFAARFNLLDRLANEGLVVIGAGDLGVFSRESRNRLADEGATKGAGRPIDGIALGHSVKLPLAGTPVSS